MVNLSVLLQAAPAQGNPMGSLIMLFGIVIVFYFFMIRPQVKRQKELRKFRESLAKGDKVITSGGIYGKIVEVDKNIVTLDAGNEVKLKVDITAVLKDSTDLAAEKK